MTKRMSASKQALLNLEKGKKFREKYPDPMGLKRQFVDMRKDLADLIKGSDYTRAQVATKLGISENLLFGKMNNPHRWKDEEIEKIIKMLY